MEKHIVDEKTGIPYTLVGDYYLPWGDLPDDEPEQRTIGILGQRHLQFIKRYRKEYYKELLTSGKLNDYLADLNEEAEEVFNLLIKQIAKQENVTDRLKDEDQMAWVRKMNNIKNRVNEIVYNELINT